MIKFRKTKLPAVALSFVVSFGIFNTGVVMGNISSSQLSIESKISNDYNSATRSYMKSVSIA